MDRIALLLCAIAIPSCAIESKSDPGPEPCSTQWFEFVEERVSTGDSEGHGPDPGSDEWRSVVEFKLGIRGDPKIPDRTTKQWCAYINEQMSEADAAKLATLFRAKFSVYVVAGT